MFGFMWGIQLIKIRVDWGSEAVGMYWNVIKGNRCIKINYNW